MAEMTEATVREIAQQVAQQAAENAAAQAATQAAQQVAQQVSEAVSQAVQKLMQTTGAATTSTTVEKEIGETGFSERYQAAGNDRSDFLFGQNYNAKGQRLSAADQTLKNIISHDNDVRTAITQMITNMVDSSNLTNKAAIDHRDHAHDLTWGVDEQKYAVADIIKTLAGSNVAQNANYDILLKAVADGINSALSANAPAAAK